MRAVFYGAATLAPIILANGPTQAQVSERERTVAFSIPAQPLSSAVVAFSRASGVNIASGGLIAADERSQGVTGVLTPTEGLRRLLAGTNYSYRFTSPSSVTLLNGAARDTGGAHVEGAIQLDTVDVSDGRVTAADAPYSTPAPTSHISQETIDRFRGSSPADIFRGTPGVMSGEARNGGGAIDVNIRGMQGMGRVAVTVDGAENGMTVYQGYQGVSNRTFVDPDLLAGVDVRKGSDANSRGIAGTVAMRTLGADDVVKPDEKWGVWVKTGFGTNTATPTPQHVGGYFFKQDYGSTGGLPGTATASPFGLDRPGLLIPASGSLSAAAAVKEEHYDLLWGYAYRKQGNYYAGANGPAAAPVLTGPRPYCCYGWYYGNYIDNAGLTNYRAGEQVLNTQLETESYLAKATVRDDNGQSLQVGYTGYRSKAGDMIASIFTSPLSQPMQQTQEDITKLDTGTVRYRWKPDDNDLIDVKANMWLSKFGLRTPVRSSFAVNVKPEDFGLPYDYLPGNDTTMWGGDVSNKSHFFLDRIGSLDFEYGMNYLSEATKPIPFTNQLNNIPSRDGTRQEVAGFGKVAYKPIDWLTLNGGLRYAHDWSQDRSDPTAFFFNPTPLREHGGYSPSAGIVLEPIKGAQFYTNYSSALRMPTLFESVAAYSLTVNPNLGPERSNNWEAGVNLIREGLFSPTDKAKLKFGYFNWDVKDYVARQYMVVGATSSGSPTYGLMIHNIDRARFEGLEFTGRYENNGFTAELAANYYLNVAFCPTTDTCASSTLSSDYATNQVPPQYSANLSVSQKFLNDDLTVGGRGSYVGPRSVGHGEVQYGAAAIVAPIDWKPYWLFDLFTEYKVTRDITLWATMENLTDQYYVDPLSLVQQPGPGRTVRLGMTGKFGGSEPASYASLARLFTPTETAKNWSGFHAGLNAAYNFAKLRGSANALNGTPTLYSAAEAPNQDIGALSFGIHAGYDHQFSNRVIVGIEADIAKSEIAGSQLTYVREGGIGTDATNLFRSRQLEAMQKSSIDWISTVRGRLGYAFNDHLMVYATGGAAFMRQNEERTQYAGATGPFGAVDRTVESFTESASLTRTGYSAGGGAEYDLGRGWSIKGEFLFARFGQKEINFNNARAGVMPDTTSTVVITPGTDAELNFDDPTCLDNGFSGPGCIIPGKPPVTKTTTTTGSSNTTTGRKLLSKIDIPMIKIGLNYRF